MNKTALTKTYTKDIQNSCLNSKKIVLSLAAISFSASCTHATLTPEIETYEETNRHAKARSGSRSKSSNNETINNLQTLTKTISSTGNTLVIESGGTITISNGGQQAVNFQPNSSTSTFLNKGTLIGGNNAASVQLGENRNNGVTIETFNNQGIIGNGSSQFGVTVWGTNSSKSTINNFSNSGTIEGKSDGIRINANVKTLINKGTIKGHAASIRSLGGTIDQLINEGIMDGKSAGIYMSGGRVKTLINKGTINHTDSSVGWGAGIKLENGSTIENIINTGTVNSAGFGIAVTHGKFGTLTIKDGGKVYGKYEGIGVGQWQTLGDLYIVYRWKFK